MATETLPTVDWMDPSPSLHCILARCLRDHESLMALFRASDLKFLIKNYGSTIADAILMSEAAADVIAAHVAPLSGKMRLSWTSMNVLQRVMNRIVQRGTYHHAPRFLDYLRRGLASDDLVIAWAILRRGEQAIEGIYKNETCDGAFPSQHSEQAFTVAVAAVLHLLAFVFQYLTGYIDRGGTKTYSSGCFDFRASYVSILLFLAAFVWIKFRQAARLSTRKRKQPEHPDDANDPSHVCTRKHGPVTKYEARYSIPVNMNKAHPVHPRRLTLGEHKTPEEAAFVWRVAQTYYEGQPGTCCVTLQGNPHTFPVPAMSEQEQGPVGQEKKDLVMKYAKDVGKKGYEKYAMQLALATGTGSNDRSLSRRTCDPSLMLAHTAHEPQNGLDAPSCSNTLHPACEGTSGEEINAGSQRFQLEHEGLAQGVEGRVISGGGEPQWPGESPPSDDRLKEISDEDFQVMCSEFILDPQPEQESPLDRNMPKDHERLRKEKELAEQEKERIESLKFCSVPHQPRSLESVGEELNPGLQFIQEQHEGRSQNFQGLVLSEGAVSAPCEDMLPSSPAMSNDINIDEMFATITPEPPEGGVLDGHKTCPESAPIPGIPHSLVAEAVEQGSEAQFGSLQNLRQGMSAANPVPQNVAFEATVGEQSESEQQTLEQQQPQAYGEEFLDLDHQEDSESQNPGLQQGYTPSQHISDPPIEKDPYEIISELLERNGQLRKDNDRLLKEKDLDEQEKKRLRKEKELDEQEKEHLRDNFEGLKNGIRALLRKSM